MHKSKDGYDSNFDFCDYEEKNGFWGLGHCDHDAKEIVLTQKYYVYGQFSRYIRPGMTMIHIDENTLGAYDKENHKCVIVAVNPTDKEMNTEFDFGAFEKAGKTCKVYVTNGSTKSGKKWFREDDLKFNEKTLLAHLSPHSVTTFITDETLLKRSLVP